MATSPGSEIEKSAVIRALDRSECALMPVLTARFGHPRLLGSTHARTALARHSSAVVEARVGTDAIARVRVVRTARSAVAELPTWERVSDGGLGRSDDASGGLAWIHSFETIDVLDDASAARLLARFVDHLARACASSVAVVVDEDHVDLVRGALAATTTFPLPGHFPPGADGRRLDAVLLLRPGSRGVVAKPRVERLRVGAVQLASRARASREESLAHWEYLVARAAGGGAAIVLFPEYTTLEWLVHEGGSRDAHAAVRALDAHRETYLATFARLARAHGVTIVAGTHLVKRSETVLENVAFAFTPDGRVLEQPKLHPTPYEAETFGVTPGAQVHVFELAGVPTSIVTCYDAEFPEVARAARARGAELMLVPYNTETARGHHRVRRCASSRAVESQAFVVTAGMVGRFDHPFDSEDHIAASAAFCPSDGDFPEDGLLRELPPNVEDVLFVDLDFAALDRCLRGGAVRPWLDRRDPGEL